MEYIFYQKDGNYHEINTETVPSKTHPLGVQNYDIKSRNNSVKAYQNPSTILEVKNIGYLIKYKDELVKSEYANVEMVEALLVLYRISPTGQIELEKQRSFKYDIDYHQTKDGKMRLKLS